MRFGLRGYGGRESKRGDRRVRGSESACKSSLAMWEVH